MKWHSICPTFTWIYLSKNSNSDVTSVSSHLHFTLYYNHRYFTYAFQIFTISAALSKNSNDMIMNKMFGLSWCHWWTIHYHKNVISIYFSLEDKGWHQPADIYNLRVFLKEGRLCIHLEKIWLNRCAPVIALAEAFGEVISQLKGISEEKRAMKGHKKTNRRETGARVTRR